MHAPFTRTFDSIDLIANITPSNRAELLAQSHTHHFSKGQGIFFHGQPVQNFFVLLSGRVKLFRTSENGSVMVVHVASPGELLLTSAIFSDCISPISAEAMDDVELLAIPARLFRQIAARDGQLSYNLLSHLAGNANQYLTQLNQLNLKSVPQRVGNFILREFLSTQKQSKTFDLPYDKTTIASHLGMQPESLSRALQQLRSNGIDIDRDTITLPHLFALCDYCDVDTAQRCALHGTADCPNPQC